MSDFLYCLRHPWARAGLLVFTAAALFLGGTLVAWWPVHETHAALEREIGAKRRAAAHAQQSAELRQAYERAASGVASLERKLAHGATQAQLVQSFARLARRHGVRIVSETYEEGPNGTAPALAAELSVQAAYPALRDFVRDLAMLPTWSEVQEVRIERSSGAAPRGRIRIVTYRAKSA